jgi:hypothetical protein
VTDILDRRLIYLSDDGDGTYDHITGLWQIGELATNQIISLNINVKVNGIGNIPNLAMLKTPQVDLNKNVTVNIESFPNFKNDTNFSFPHLKNDSNFLKNTGLPLIILALFLACIGIGSVYRRK